ncbi:MAG: sensor histidine kinase [Thermodesulfatator sp.]|nr:MAG: sensor histidine kinase [Thermodesulfatator sp.]
MFSICTPIIAVDVAGSLAMIIISLLCFRISREISKTRPENVFYSYLNWLVAALLAFSLSRPLGHIVKHILLFLGKKDCWMELSPVSGSINTAVFFMITSITLFFRKMQRVMEKMGEDKKKIERISQELLNLNQNTEILVSERTRAELALNVAHEIRNPVMIIGGMIRRILNKSPSEEELRQYLKSILDQVTRLDNIVKKFETIKGELKWAFTITDLNKIAHSAVNMILPEAQAKGINIRLDVNDSPLLVEANANLIKLSIVHCLRNAIEASSEGDTIEVKTMRAKYGAKVEIIDHGIGMPESILKNIFVPFFGTKEKSSGLGLCVVKQIIEEHGGTISISSVEGQGTVVHIFLPTRIGTAKTWGEKSQPAALEKTETK